MILGIQMDVKTFSLQKESRFTSKRWQHMGRGFQYQKGKSFLNHLPTHEYVFQIICEAV